MKNRQLSILLILSSLFLGSCSPVYKTTYDLIPPKTNAGLMCTRNCQQGLQRCEANCQAQFRQCGIKAEQQARKNLPALEQAYPLELENWLLEKARYEKELAWYEWRHDLARDRRKHHYDRCRAKGKSKDDCYKRLRDFGFPSYLDRPEFNRPKPLKPDLASETARILATTCRQHCKCQSTYRNCYASCGGKVLTKKICIKHCPP